MKETIRRILVVEDDPEDEYAILEAIENRFGVKAEIIRTESAFFGSLDRIAANPPDIIVIDVMLRWTDPSPDQTARDERKPFHVAGIRCLDALRNRDETRSIPVVLYTNLGKEDFKQLEDPVVTKGLDHQNLVDAIEARWVQVTH